MDICQRLDESLDCFSQAVGRIRLRQTQADFLDMEESWLSLARSLEASDRLTDFIGTAKINKDLRGVITGWNKGAEELFGYSAEEALGQPGTLLIPPKRLDEDYAILQRVQRGGRVDNFETIRRRKDGSLINVSLTHLSRVRKGRSSVL
jgi:PAS domain S-box-containing protein